MDCVRCKHPMVILELSGVEIDHCFSCGGIWLDQGELELLAGTSPSNPALPRLEKTPHCKEQKIPCPICGKKMDKMLCSLDTSFPLDQCPKGHGLWFDRGELEKILTKPCSDNAQPVLLLLKEIFKKQPQ